MVNLRSISSDEYKQAGFCTKKAALEVLASRGKTGRDFKSVNAVIEYVSLKYKNKRKRSKK